MRRSLAPMVAGAAAAVVAGVLVTGVGSGRAGTESAAGRSCAVQRSAIRAVPERIEKAWAENDADAVAAVFSGDTDFVIGDGTFLRGRAELRRYMTAAFDTFLKGSRVTAPVESTRCLGRHIAVVHTLGGILLPGETEVPPERRGVQVFIVTQQGRKWLVDVYQNTRIEQQTEGGPAGSSAASTQPAVEPGEVLSHGGDTVSRFVEQVILSREDA